VLPLDPLQELAIAAIVWFAIHPAIAGSPLRAALVHRLGENGFRGAFALLSLAALSFLAIAYSRAPCAPLWTAPRLAYFIPITVMPPAFVLAAGAFSVPNPTAAGSERALERDEPARGVLRITRHPFLVAVAIWSFVHALVNGNEASLWFFGSLFLTALAGMRDIDAKRDRLNPEAYGKYRARTSIVPFVAIARGRNRLVLRELWIPLAIGCALTLLALLFHDDLFRVPPIPR
jgi:uncharacterized membrane protein